MAVRFRNDKLVLTKYEAKHPLVGADGEKKKCKKNSNKKQKGDASISYIGIGSM